MEKSVTDLLKTTSNVSGSFPPLIMDEIMLVSRNPLIVYSRFFPDVLRLVRQSGVVTSRMMSMELKFVALIAMCRRNEPYNQKELNTLPLSFRQYIIQECIADSVSVQN